MSRNGETPTVIRVDPAALHLVTAPGVTRVSKPRRRQVVAEIVPGPYPLDLPPAEGSFHFTRHLALLCQDICQRMSAFAHIDMQRVLVTYTLCRDRRLWGLQAKLTPLRFPQGAETVRRQGHDYRIQRFFVGDLAMLYVLTIYLPRFLNQSFDEKLITVFHELYHIAPQADGSVRRFEGRGAIHSHSRREYDEQMAGFARQYLALRPPPVLFDFLRLSFADLESRYRGVCGVRVAAPKLIPASRWVDNNDDKSRTS